MIKTVALIPVRGGSKSIPFKNIKELCGKPLVYWTAKAACKSKYINEVYIATDSPEIRRTVDYFCQNEKDIFSKLKVIGRSAENASDTASTESVMLEFAQNYDFENIVLIQATSPLLMGQDIDGGMEVFEKPGTDSVISLVRQKRFIWNSDGDRVSASNYDVFNRPRRQDFDGFLMENGAFYITTKEALLRTHNRISGTIRPYIMPEDTAIEIDEPDDFIVLERLLQKRLKNSKHTSRHDIRMVVMDCDGCLTDGGMYYSESGDELKKFNARDGMAISKVHEKGIITGIITGENMQLNQRRADKLHMDFIIHGAKDKLTELKHICSEYNISLKEVLYIGDDLNDIEAMKATGYCACPADASIKVRQISDYIAKKNGGAGAVREILEKTILQLI